MEIMDIFNINFTCCLYTTIMQLIDENCPKFRNPDYSMYFKYQCVCSICYTCPQLVFQRLAENGMKYISQNETPQKEIKLKTIVHAKLCGFTKQQVADFYEQKDPFQNIMKDYIWFDKINKLFLEIDYTTPLH